MNEKMQKKQAISKEIKPFKANPYADLSLLSKFDLLNGPLAWGKKTVRLPKVRLVSGGLSVDGYKIPIHNFGQVLNSPLGRLIALASLPRHVLADNVPASTYYFQDLKAVVYKLYLSGAEDLNSVITSLKQGECGVSAAEKIPADSDLKLVNSYFDHGAGTTVPMPAAVLSVEKIATANQTVVDCAANLLNEAHDAWENKITSGPAIASIVGAFVGMVLLAGFLIYMCNRLNKKKEAQEGSSLLSLRREMSSRRPNLSK